ncbi:MAG: hypoxanthine phosphoribosyltransferase [Clostridia bacterium]|nr:hypoxanthine phosphoribosyltransferase [Clostridia bacterium]
MEILSNHKVLIDEPALDKRVGEIAEQINNEFAGEKVIIVGVLKGSFMFMSDLIKKINLDTEVYFLKAESYGRGTETSGEVKITKDIETDINGENVIVVEDIIDSGFTMREVFKLLSARNPKALKLCSCLSKPDRRECEITIDYLGFEIPDEFVIGYGLDYAEKYRNLPYIGYIEVE